jgi:asparagine synthase (glutamine-hydrolysing)
MCGIAGLYRMHGHADDTATVQRMLARLERRGPEGDGLTVERRAVLGHRRLAILDLSSAGRQPMVGQDGRFVVVLNGEIYNFRDIAHELGLRAEELRSQTDTEVLLHAWQRWGAEALGRMVGQWAFAVYDRNTDRLTLARDRFGEKPLFYAADRDRLVFASSLVALFEDRTIRRTLDSGALLEYLTLRYVVSPRTVIDGVLKLEGGHLLELSPDRGLEERVWYRHVFRRSSRPADRNATASQFGELLERACARCLVSDRPVGLLLSDGIDSNALLAAMPHPDPGVTCFTFRLRGGGASDVPSDIVAPGHDLVRVEASRAELAAHFDEFCADLTEPVGDMAALPSWMIIRAGRGRATVFLCGHGGDEILGGYRLSQDLFRLELLRRLSVLPIPLVRGTLRRYLNGAEGLEASCRRLRAATAACAPAVARFLIDRPLAAKEVCDLSGGSPAASETYLATIDLLYEECDADTTALDRTQHVLVKTFLAANILSWADSVAMSSSAELRMPYLDRDLVDYVANLPAKYRVPAWPGRSNTKRMLRDWARPRLPADVIARSKRGFRAGSLEGLLRAIPRTAHGRVLESRALRSALPGLELRMRSIPESCTGSASLLWTLLVLATWCDAHGVT